jgi:hypothetical protein
MEYASVPFPFPISSAAAVKFTEPADFPVDAPQPASASSIAERTVAVTLTARFLLFIKILLSKKHVK